MKKYVVSTCAVLSIFQASVGQSTAGRFSTRIQSLQETITSVFYDKQTGYYREFDKRDSGDKKAFSYLWPLCGLIQAANESEKAGLSTISFDHVLKKVYAYEDRSAPAPAYGSYIVAIDRDDRYYDDNQWIGIACLDAFERTGKKSYLEEGKKVYRFMMTGFDTVSGGGLYWKEKDLSTKNTCSNGPGVIVALQLYKATKEKPYLDTALLLYNWVNRYLLSPSNVYYDNLKLPSGKIDTHTYTYNTGTMLESAVLLFEITRDGKYLEQAKQLAEGAYVHFFRNGRWPGHAWFNAVLLRGYIALYRHDKERKYIDAFIADGDARWEKERDERGLLGRRKKKELIDQAAMLEIYARLYLTEK